MDAFMTRYGEIFLPLCGALATMASENDTNSILLTGQKVQVLLNHSLEMARQPQHNPIDEFSAKADF